MSRSMARLGTKARPAVLRSQTQDRALALLEYCTTRGWEVIVGVESDKPEDITDMLRLEGMADLTTRRASVPGRNDQCSCGSGLKFKKCCLSAQAGPLGHGKEDSET